MVNKWRTLIMGACVLALIAPGVAALANDRAPQTPCLVAATRTLENPALPQNKSPGQSPRAAQRLARSPAKKANPVLSGEPTPVWPGYARCWLSRLRMMIAEGKWAQCVFTNINRPDVCWHLKWEAIKATMYYNLCLLRYTLVRGKIRLPAVATGPIIEQLKGIELPIGKLDAILKGIKKP